MFFIESERLKMIPLTHQLLQLVHTNRPAMEQSLGLNISAMQIDELYISEAEDAMINFWLPKNLEHPEEYKDTAPLDAFTLQYRQQIRIVGLSGNHVELTDWEDAPFVVEDKK